MEQGTVKFAAFTDLHLDIMHDGARRLDAFLNAAEQEDVDFIIISETGLSHAGKS